MVVIIHAVLIAALATVVFGQPGMPPTVSKDGQCGPNSGICPYNTCCSKYGFCGESSGHCGVGCQKDYGICWDGDKPPKSSAQPKAKLSAPASKADYPISANSQCGEEFGTRCPYNTCCSKYGFCGKTSDHCGNGCQKDYGICWDGDKPPKSPAQPKAPASKADYPISANSQCGEEFGTRCPYNTCCSKYGFCGKTSDHCENGCQKDYGICWDGDKPPKSPVKLPAAKSSAPVQPPAAKSSAPAQPKADYPIGADGQCGEGSGTRCPGKTCCSKYGFCGESSGHCGNGCQKDYGICWDGDKPPKSSAQPKAKLSAPVQPPAAKSPAPAQPKAPAPAPKADYPIGADGQCGEGSGTRCPDRTCCSGKGFCGKTPSHCGVDCQKSYGSCLTPEALARLLAKSSASAQPKAPAPVQPKASAKSSAKSPAPAPKTDYPISADGRCGKEFKTKCPDRTCCSGSGFCGKTKSHCGDGCQKGYGSCLTPEALARLRGEL
ncbi:hypothetical protein MT418_001369 [Batrachochytrium dendrobatidis]